MKERALQNLHRCFERSPDDLPWFINLCVTARCNLNCRMCQSNVASHEEPATERWLRFFDRLGAWLPRPRVVTLTGGEPLMRDDVLTLVKRLAELGFEPRLNTNGALLDIECIHALVDAGLRVINLSFHGVGETHDRLRNAPGLFQGVMDMIEYMCERTNLAVRAVGVINAIGAREMPELVRRLAAFPRFGVVHFQAVIPTLSLPWSSSFFYADALWPRDPEVLAQVLDVLDELERMKRDGLPINNPPSQFAQWRRYFRDPMHAFQNLPCDVGDDNLIALSDGAITFCDHLGRLGTIDDDPRALWESPAAARLREDMRRCRRACNYRVNCCYVEQNC